MYYVNSVILTILFSIVPSTVSVENHLRKKHLYKCSELLLSNIDIIFLISTKLSKL